nr:hypothetical protein [uncultured Pseudodesulfovibrio sp.]
MNKCFNIIFLFSLLIMTGCASSQMMKVPTDIAPYSADPEKATVVFMRPSSFGGAIQSYAFQYDDESPEFVGIVSTNYKIAYQTTPGKHLFMIMGENADFLQADLAPNHIYYVVIEPHMGFMTARFSLDPILASQFDSQSFKDDLAECDFVQNTPASTEWFEKHKADIIKKYQSYYPDWLEDVEDQHHLTPEDGRPLN